ncbi:MAG: FAD-dependent oxidoreductase [Gammaproteobacteria bacterium]|nr:FAD-dependent oxidoreductase [Gammaproteobacteria bacterium]
MEKHLEALKDAVTRPLWHDPDIMPEPLPPLSSDAKCELLIVGGGFTGLWAAVQLKERSPDTDIILIEQTFVGDGASGRCGGFLSTTLTHGETNTAYRFADEAERLEELGVENMRELLETLERYDIDARYEQTGELYVALNEDAARELQTEYAEALAEDDDVVWLDKDALREQVNSPMFHSGVWDPGGQDGVVDPARLCWGLKEVLLDRLGVRIFEGTRLKDVVPVGDSAMKAICDGGVIHSDKVLMATNAFTSRIGKIRRSIIPVWDYQIATEPLTDEQMDRIAWGKKSRHAIADAVNMFHYFRLTKDNRITWGGGGAVRYYFNNGIDRKLINAPKCYEQLAKEFLEMFPQLDDVKFSHQWGGIIATSTRFCMVPGVAYDGRMAWSVGYTGHGVGASRFGARIGIELLGYGPTDIIEMKFVTKRALPWAPEPFRWLGVRLTQRALKKADRNNGKRGLWLKFLDALGLGFSC